MSESIGQVLVVDDEPQVREMTRRALSQRGISCDLAGDGVEALRLVSTKPYAAVVTDLRMPRHHGYALCNDLEKLPQPPSVLVVTALSDDRLIRDLMARGVEDVLRKPVDYAQLTEKVVGMLSTDAKGRKIRLKKANNGLQQKNLLHQIECSLVELTEMWGDRLDSAFDIDQELPDPPRAVRDFIRRLAESEAAESAGASSVVLPKHEARRRDRVTCYTIAQAAPVNREYKPTGEPFKLALRDVSESGGRLLNSRATNARYLAVSWNASQLVAKRIQVLWEVRRCQPCGPFYDIGGQFLMAD